MTEERCPSCHGPTRFQSGAPGWCDRCQPLVRPDFTIGVGGHTFTLEGVTTGAGMIVQERRRQVDQEGYSPEHDRGQRWAITRAGIAYAIASLSTLTDDQHDEAWAWWPWSTEAWKPKDALADLVRAGALIAAAIDAMLASEPGLVAEDALIARLVDDEFEARFETASNGGEM